MAVVVLGALVLLAGGVGAAWWIGRVAPARARREAALEARARAILSLPTTEAERRLAALLSDPTRVSTKSATAPPPPDRLAELPATLRPLFCTYAQVATADGRVRVGAAELRRSRLRPGLVRLGGEGGPGAEREIVAAPGGEIVFVIHPADLDILPGDGVPSLFHLLLLAVAAYEVAAGLPPAEPPAAAGRPKLTLVPPPAAPARPTRDPCSPPVAVRTGRRRARTRLGRERHQA